MVSFLTTKTYIPQPKPGFVARPRLISRLEQGIGLGHRLFLVSAPAGYGKTSLLTEWLYGAERPYAWLALDDGDNDPARFFTYFSAALKTLPGGVGQTAAEVLQSAKLPSVDTLVALVVNDIATANLRFTVVLDDYHLIQTEFIHEVMQDIIDHLPPDVNVVLLTREDPPLSVPKWRARDQVTEIRAGDLRFTPTEAISFFRQTMQLELTDDLIKALGSRTEGWIAGLQLAAVSLKGWAPERANAFIEEFNGSHRFVIDYLMEEVLRQQDDETKRFLACTSVLNRLSASLCNAVTGRSDSKEMLTRLEQANLFLVPLDEHREWYRYHRLFADFLQTEISAEEQTKVHAKAAAWFDANNCCEEAVVHSLAAKDYMEAGRLTIRAADRMVLKGQMRTLLKWLEALPRELVHFNGELLSQKACNLFLTGRIDEALSCIGEFAGLPAEQVSTVSRGRIKALQAWIANAREAPEGLGLAEEALELIGDADLFLRMFVLIPLGQARRKTGDMSGSSLAFREALHLSQKTGSSMAVNGAAIELAFNLYIEGKLTAAVLLCKQVLDQYMALNGKLPAYAGLLYIPLGVFAYEANDLALAEDYLLKGIETSKKLAVNTVSGGDGERYLARLRFAQGRVAEACAILQEACSELDGGNLPVTKFRHEAQLAEFRLKQGDLSTAQGWAAEEGLAPGDKITSLREQSYFIYARILLAAGQYDEAKILLHNLECFARDGGRYGRLITVNILQALMHKKLGCTETAFSYLGEAVRLASAEGYRRVFLDEGPELAGLLTAVHKPDFVGGLSNHLANDYAEFSTTPKEQGLVEPLSEREREILQLIYAGLSNASIAQKLFVTVGTVKWHANNIYAKLQVKNRTQAIARARELHLL